MSLWAGMSDAIKFEWGLMTYGIGDSAFGVSSGAAAAPAPPAPSHKQEPDLLGGFL
jgi:hypothetical protein